MIAVIGADGLLGSWLSYLYPKEVFGFSHKELDVTDESSVYAVLKALKPDAVINCAGITNKRNVNPEHRLAVNARAPIRLRNMCDALYIKLVHISTDCVFSGEKEGSYTERDKPDAYDNYGWSKAEGEIYRYPHITVRTSFVGWPDPKGRSLLSWMHHTPDPVIEGYRKVSWNGLTTAALAPYLIELAYNKEWGIEHIYGEVLSKYEVLEAVNRIYATKKSIVPVDYPVKNMVLSSVSEHPKECKIPFFDQLSSMELLQNGFNKWLSEQY